MLGNYVSPKVATCEKKEEISKTIKKNDDITPPNKSFTDNENEKIREKLRKIHEEMKEVDREFREKLEEEQEKRRKETIIYLQNSLMHK